MSPASAGDVLLVTQHPFPGDRDVRARRIAASLSELGARVAVWAPFCTEGADREGVFTVRAPLGRVPVSFGRELPARVSPLSPRLMMSLIEAARTVRPRVLVSRDLRFALPVWGYAAATNTPLWFDLAENMPAMVRAERAGSGVVTGAKESVARTLERLAARWSSLLTVVSNENRDRLVRTYGLDEKKVFVLENAPKVDISSLPKQSRSMESALALVYVGIITELRGLQALVEAVHRCISAGLPVHLDIWGGGRALRSVEERVGSLKMDESVRFRGWLDGRELPHALARYDAGVIPHRVNPHTSTTIPNKAYEYMAAGIPVLATSMPPLVRLLQEDRAGLTVPDSIEGLASGIEALWKMGQAGRELLGMNGQRAVLERRNWGTQVRRLAPRIEALGLPSDGWSKAASG